MLDRLYQIVAGVCPWLQQEQEAKKLALKIESQVRTLSKMEDVAASVPDAGLVAILASTSRFIDRLQSLTEERLADQPAEAEPALPTEAVVEPLTTSTSFTIAKDPEPSKTTKALIQLRDHVLLAIEENTTGDVRMLQNIDRKLGKILEQEGVQTIDDQAQFNYERQQAMETKATDDPNLDGMVCATLRPGYLFDGKLIRPQEVIIYKFAEPTS